jgi:hypothetical protein
MTLAIMIDKRYYRRIDGAQILGKEDKVTCPVCRMESNSLLGYENGVNKEDIFICPPCSANYGRLSGVTQQSEA